MGSEDPPIIMYMVLAGPKHYLLESDLGTEGHRRLMGEDEDVHALIDEGVFRELSDEEQVAHPVYVRRISPIRKVPTKPPPEFILPVKRRGDERRGVRKIRNANLPVVYRE